ncbi:MAG TPA: BON domain-containing protein [Candidatus Binataceae bacterium]|nr:BON domain-containing protein [Candidatus Binataceae bacterium]
MNLKKTWKFVVPAAILSVSMAGPVFAQSHPSASDSMDAAGHSMERAGSDTATAAKDTYHGAATALTDTKITAKVKTALHEDEATEHGDIHVRTVAGVVTLRGRVASEAEAARAERLAQSTEGVREVDNKLHVTKTASD